jgi:nicotinate-nucleotide adenylyltransferase
VHRAHLELARRARDQVGLDEIWWIPAGAPPHKTAQTITAAHHRVEMLRAAIEGESGFSLCTWEVDHPGVHPTVDTVTALQAQHPEGAFHLLLGEDSLRALDTWVRPHRLARLCRFVVLARGETTDRRPHWRGAPVIWLQGPALDVSSTAVREALAAGRAPADLPPAVLAYVRRHDLYRGEATP